MTEINDDELGSDNELDDVLTDYGFALTVTGRPGLYRFSCSCGYGAAMIATRDPGFALRIAAGHLDIHKPIESNENTDPFEGLG